jgi:hypothetical protein
MIIPQNISLINQYNGLFYQILILFEQKLLSQVSYEDLNEKKIKRLDKLIEALKLIHNYVESVCNCD